MGNEDSKPAKPPKAHPRTDFNYVNNGGQQQVHNVSRGQGQNLDRPQDTSQANLNAQRIQANLNEQRRQANVNEQKRQAYLNAQLIQDNLNEQRRQQMSQQSKSSTSESVQYTRVGQLPGNDVAKVMKSAPPIPPLPHRHPLDSSFAHVELPKPLVPVMKQEASGSVPKPAPRNIPNPNKLPTTYHEITMDLNTYLPMLKASIKDVKDPKFLQFHKELNKTKPLSDIRLSLINNQHLSDVQLIVGDKKEVIYGHKMFLITASSLFLTHFETNNEVQLIVENVETPILLELLKYCYTSKVNITEQNVLELLKAGNYLKVRQISNLCHSFISNLFNEDSIFVIFEKALEQKNEMFEKKCIAFMLNNEEKCFSSEGFYKIGFSSLLDIVGRCKFNNEKNEEIIKKWNYGAKNMEFAPSENTLKEAPKPMKQHPGQSKPKEKKAKASTSNSSQPGPMIPSLFDLNLNAPKTSDFVFRDDDNESVVSKDDDREMKTKIFVTGSKNRGVSEFSRLDLSCKKSILLHEIGFTADLARCGPNIKVSFSLFEGNHRRDIHSRTIQNDKPGMRINYIKFDRNPLKIYIGQKFFIKLNFPGPVSLAHVTGDQFTHPDIFEPRGDIDKNYLNCISYFIVSDMPRI